MKERRAKLAVFTTDIIDKAVSIYSEFKNGDEKKRLHWIYKLMARYKLSVRTRTRVIQISADAMQTVKYDYCKRSMTSFRNRINNPKSLVKMDEKAVFLHCAFNSRAYSVNQG